MKTPFSRSGHPRAGNLRTQLILTIVVPVAVLLLALILVGVVLLFQLTQTLVQVRDVELVQLAARQIAADWDVSVYLLSQLAAADPVRHSSVTEIATLLQENTALYQRFDRICVTDAEGSVVAASSGVSGEALGAHEYFQRARRLRRPVRSSVYEDAQGRRVIAVAVPYYDAARRFGGCVLGVWDLAGERLGASIRGVRVGEDGYAFLVDANGTILYHPEADFIGATWYEHPAVAAVMRGETGAETVRWRAMRTTIAYAPITFAALSSSLVADETWEGWGLLTSQLWSDIMAPVQPYLVVTGILLALALAVPMGFLISNSRRIAAPLQSLAAQAEQVASGDLTTQVSIDAGFGEVRELEVAFNTMVQQLSKYRIAIQNYVVSILNSQEQERKRVARELHDDTAQALVVLGRRLEAAAEVSDGATIARELDELRDMVDDTLRSVRSFTRDLRPPLLEELGLPRSLEILGDRVAREEPLAVQVQIHGKPRPLLPQVELGLFRLAQESLNNVRRHAHATQAVVDLEYGDETLTLRIADNGVGFDAPDDPADLVHSGRLGLMGIHERARLFGGHAEIRSAAGQGTVVTIGIPMSPIVLAEGTPAAPVETQELGKNA